MPVIPLRSVSAVIAFALAKNPGDRYPHAQAFAEAGPEVEAERLVQRAHDSGVAPPGRLVAGREYLLTHLYRRIVEMMEA